MTTVLKKQQQQALGREEEFDFQSLTHFNIQKGLLFNKKCKVHKIWPFHRKKRNRNCPSRSALLDLLDKDFKSGLTEIIKKRTK